MDKNPGKIVPWKNDKPACPHAKSEMTPCYHKDGEDCLVDGCCPGCGLSVEALAAEKEIPVAEQIRFRRRALDAEAECARLEDRIAIQLRTIDRQNEQLTKANSAYQRIFDEKVERCEYIAQMKTALLVIISMNRGTAKDQYGDPEKAEEWACVKTARKAIILKETQPTSQPETLEPTELPDCKYQVRDSRGVKCDCIGVTAINCDKNCKFAEPETEEKP